MIPKAHHKDIQPHDCQYVDIDPHDKARQLSIYIYTLKTLVTLVLSQLSYRLGGPPWHNMLNFAQLVTNLQVIQRVDIPISSSYHKTQHKQDVDVDKSPNFHPLYIYLE